MNTRAAVHKKRLDVKAFKSLLQVSDNIFDQKFPLGDMLFDLVLRVEGTATGGSAKTNGEKGILKSITLESNAHGRIYDDIDGLGLYRIVEMLMGVAGVAAHGGTTFSCNFRMPLCFNRTARPYDMGMLLKGVSPTLIIQSGVMADVITGGTTLDTGNISVSFRTVPNPTPGRVPPGEYPSWMPYIQRLVCTPAATGKYEIELPTADRDIHQIFISQRNTTTDAEVTDEVTAESTEISLKASKDYPVERVRWTDLANDMAQEYGLTSMPSGWNVLDFVESKRLRDALNVKDVPKGNLWLTLDAIVKQTNESFYVYIVGRKPINSQLESIGH